MFQRPFRVSWVPFSVLVLAIGIMAARADERDPSASDKSEVKSGESSDKAADGMAEQFEAFEKALSGVKFVGQFTVLGKEPDRPAKEEYEIHSVKKLPQGDLWLFTARIKYGQTDVKLPIPLEVKWAGRTPVITLDNITIPTLGTFSSRVVVDGDKYAGTWTHGEVGGHLLGVIEKLKGDAK